MGTGVSSTSRREASMATYGVVSARGATKRRMRARSETSLSSLVEASFKLGSALLRTSGTLGVSLLIGVGATVQGLLCVSP